MPPRTRAAASSFPPVPANCVVTGGSGFVGQRLVEMLVERGAARVVSFDIAPKPRDALEDARVVYQQGDLTKLEDVLRACEARRLAAQRKTQERR
jgi:nucleoside-diphosphate-sugar epimerase